MAILGGSALEGSPLDSLIQPAAFLSVGGGTTAAVMVQTPLSTFVKSMKMAAWVFLPPRLDFRANIERIAVAFVATIGGVALANLFFLPMANKIKGGTTAASSRR